MDAQPRKQDRREQEAADERAHVVEGEDSGHEVLQVERESEQAEEEGDFEADQNPHADRDAIRSAADNLWSTDYVSEFRDCGDVSAVGELWILPNRWRLRSEAVYDFERFARAGVSDIVFWE